MTPGRSTTPTRPIRTSRAVTRSSRMARLCASSARSKVSASCAASRAPPIRRSSIHSTGIGAMTHSGSRRRAMRLMTISKATIERAHAAEDLRLIGDPSCALFGRLRWLAGIYALRLTESDQQMFAWDAYDAGPGGTPSGRVARERARGDESGLADRSGPTEQVRDALGGPAARAVCRRRLGQRRRSDSVPRETNHMIGGNLSWTEDLGEGEHLRDAREGSRAVDSSTLAPASVGATPRVGPEALWSVEPGSSMRKAQARCSCRRDRILYATVHNVGLSVRAAATNNA